jgi:hypothetical protein
MEELRQQAVDLLAGLTDEQLLMVLAYVQCVKDGEEAIRVAGFEGFAQESA